MRMPWVVWWKSRTGCDDWLMVLTSQSTLKRWVHLRTFNSLSIVLWIATCWWYIGRSGKIVSECWCCGQTVVGGIPTMQVGGWPVCELVLVVSGHLVLDVVLLDVVEMLSAG